MVEKKGYKQTEIGIIPEDWEVKSVGEIGNVITGSTPSRTNESFWNGFFVWISAQDFKSKYIYNSVEKITEQGKKTCRVIPKDSVLVTCIASIGLNAISKIECATNQQINSIVCDKKFNFEYVYYQFNNRINTLKLLAGQTAVPIINKGQFEKFELCFPSNLAEQTAIASVLSDMDEYISSLERLIAKKKAIKQGTMQNLLTGKIRLKEFNGEWVEKRIDEIIERFATGLNPRLNFTLNTGGTNYYVTIKNFFDGVLKLGDNCDKVDNIALRLINNRSDLKKDDILFSSIGRVGDAYLITETPKNWNINESVFALRPNKMLVSQLFLYYFLKSEAMKDSLINNTTGSTLSSIKMNHLKVLTGYLPSEIAEQTAIATILSDMDTEIEALQAKLSKAKLVKQGAMQELLTGKIRLINTSLQTQNIVEKRIIPAAAHVVGGHIVNKLYNSKGWGRTKLQKSIHLVNYYCQLDFGSEYIQNVAGPDDQFLMNYIDSKFKQYNHVCIEITIDDRGHKHYNYIPTSKIAEVEQAFERYMVEKQKTINELLSKIKKMDLARAEIVSTLYAVWNNRIIKGQTINDDLLLDDFYDWSEHKSVFSRNLVLRGLNYMRQEDIIPIGWGKYIDKNRI